MKRVPKIIYLLFVFIVIILLAEGVYYFFIVKKRSEIPPTESPPIAEEKAEELEQTFGQIKEKVESRQEELNQKSSSKEKCLFVPPIDPEDGIYRTDKIRTNVYDYYYEGRIVEVKETVYEDCPFINLVLNKIGPFDLNIPSNLLADTDIGKISALIYQDHLGERVQIKIQYEQNPVDPSSLKTIEWQPLVFFID